MTTADEDAIELAATAMHALQCGCPDYVGGPTEKDQQYRQMAKAAFEPYQAQWKYEVPERGWNQLGSEEPPAVRRQLVLHGRPEFATPAWPSILAACTCPDVDTTTLAEHGQGVRSTRKGLDPACPQHGSVG